MRGLGVQTGQYSTQIFSLAVLLSSLFVYNQMGGIDEAALDRLSLVTEMTKHIRVKAGATSGRATAAI
jgi:Guanylate-binding protein, N-terminal domain